MRKLMILSALCLTTPLMAEYKTGDFPKTFDEILEIETDTGDSCADQGFGEYSYCLNTSYEAKDIYVEAYIYLEKGHAGGLFDTKDQIFSAYIDAERWPEYTARSAPVAILEFPTSEIIKDTILDNGDRQAVHHFAYTSKAPIIGRFSVSGTSTYNVAAVPVEGAALSATFKNTQEWGGDWDLITPMPVGKIARGLKGQDANIHIVELADDEGHILIYRTRIRLATTLALGRTYKSTGYSVEDILTGMFMIGSGPGSGN